MDQEVFIPLQEEGQFAPAKSKADLTKAELNLPYFLRRTAAVEVNVNLEQVVALIGEEKTNEICIVYNKIAEARQARYKKNSLIPKAKRTSLTGIGMFNRLDLLAAMEEAQGEGVGEQDETPPSPQGKALPDPMKLKLAREAAGDPKPLPGEQDG